MALICAVAFLAISFAHNIHDFDVATPGDVIATKADTFVISFDNTKKAPIGATHCHACEIIAVASIGPAPIDHLIRAEIPGFRAVHSTSRAPVVEIPPPIANI